MAFAYLKVKQILQKDCKFCLLNIAKLVILIGVSVQKTQHILYITNMIEERILENIVMLKKIVVAALFAVGSSAALADPDVGCGVGSQVWAGQKGTVPKILAATTNGIFTNQLLGITFGTLGCHKGGTVTAQVVNFTNENAESLARDMAVGQGESLNVLAELMQIKSADKARFFEVSKENFAEIYSSQNQNTLQVLDALQNVMAKDEVLKAYV